MGGRRGRNERVRKEAILYCTYFYTTRPVAKAKSSHILSLLPYVWDVMEEEAGKTGVNRIFRTVVADLIL